MWKRLIAVFAVMLFCAPLAAQERSGRKHKTLCLPYPVMARIINERMERLVFAGKVRGAPGVGMFLYRSDKGSWSLLAIDTRGNACLSVGGSASTLPTNKPQHSDSPP